jgi:hypothetical protein
MISSLSHQLIKGMPRDPHRHISPGCSFEPDQGLYAKEMNSELDYSQVPFKRNETLLNRKRRHHFTPVKIAFTFSKLFLNAPSPPPPTNFGVHPGATACAVTVPH